MCTARGWMSTPTAIALGNIGFREVLSSVIAGGAHEVYVVDPDGRLLGVVTDYDLLKAQLTQSDPGTPIVQLMCCNVAITRPESDLHEISPAFRDCRHSQMAVVDDGMLIGVIERRDVLRAVAALESRSESHENATGSDFAEAVRAPRFTESTVPCTA